MMLTLNRTNMMKKKKKSSKKGMEMNHEYKKKVTDKYKKNSGKKRRREMMKVHREHVIVGLHCVDMKTLPIIGRYTSSSLLYIMMHLDD